MSVHKRFQLFYSQDNMAICVSDNSLKRLENRFKRILQSKPKSRFMRISMFDSAKSVSGIYGNQTFHSTTQMEFCLWHWDNGYGKKFAPEKERNIFEEWGIENEYQ